MMEMVFIATSYSFAWQLLISFLYAVGVCTNPTTITVYAYSM